MGGEASEEEEEDATEDLREAEELDPEDFFRPDWHRVMEWRLCRVEEGPPFGDLDDFGEELARSRATRRRKKVK